MPRDNRPAAARRQQYARAHARAAQLLLSGFQALQHRGCQPSKLGQALSMALAHTGTQDEVFILPTAPPLVQTCSIPLNNDAPLFTPQLTTDMLEPLEQLKSSVDQMSRTMLLMFDAQRQLTCNVRLQLLTVTANKSVVKEQMDESANICALDVSHVTMSGASSDMAEYASLRAAADKSAAQEQEDLEQIQMLNEWPIEMSGEFVGLAERASCVAAPHWNLNAKEFAPASSVGHCTALTEPYEGGDDTTFAQEAEHDELEGQLLHASRGEATGSDSHWSRDIHEDVLKLCSMLDEHYLHTTSPSPDIEDLLQAMTLNGIEVSASDVDVSEYVREVDHLLASRAKRNLL